MTRTIDGEVISVRDVPALVEPSRPLWLRMVVWLPSLPLAALAVVLVVGAR